MQALYFDTAEHKLLGVGNGQDIREPSVKQRLYVRTVGCHFPLLALLDVIERATERQHRQRRVLEQFFEGCAISAKTDIGRMLENFERQAHAGIVRPYPGARRAKARTEGRLGALRGYYETAIDAQVDIRAGGAVS